MLKVYINVSVIKLDMHISRVFDFSRDARKIDPFLARNCEKCEKWYVPIFGPLGARFDQKSNFQCRVTAIGIKSSKSIISHHDV